MEFKITTLFVTLSGMFFLGLIGLFFLWIGWKDAANLETAQVKSHLATLQTYWTQKSGGRVKIEYDNLEADGFPFNLHVRVMKPRVVAALGSGFLILGGNYLDFQPMDDNEPAHSYELGFLQDGYARYQRASGGNDDYFLHLSQKPRVFLRKQPVNNKMPNTFNVYGFMMPAEFSLMVTQGNKSKPLSFRYSLTSQRPIWKAMVGDVAIPLHSFYSMLQRSIN